MRLRALFLLLLLLLPVAPTDAVQRFPPPQFETPHVMPTIAEPPARAQALEWLDMGVLAVGLGLAAWLVLKARSRRGVVLLGIFSLLYFGFWRQGCVCAIGTLQNLADALAHPGMVLPLGVLVFGLLPMAFALLFGRVFCAALCPHGALQDLVLVKAVKVPGWLEQTLKLVAYTYLGLAVIFAATGAGYIICQYDPFVPLFRLSGSRGMVIFGLSLLAIGMFVGRPYCRFLCPYGVVLGLLSSVSRWRVTITPDTCVQCRLCEPACPFNAINPSTLEAERRAAPAGRGTILALLALLPLLVAGSAYVGLRAGDAFALRNATVSLSERVYREDLGEVADTTDASAAFRATGVPVATLHADARAAQRRMRAAGAWCGAWVGLVVGVKLLVLAVRRRRPDYEADRAACVGCARCYTSCPQEQIRLYGKPLTPPAATATPAGAA